MLGIRVDAEDPVDRRATLRTINEVADELYFRPAFYAGDGAVSGGAAFASAVVPGTSSVEFPNAGAPAWRIERLRRGRWRAASLRITLAYTAIAGSTNNFRFLLAFRERGAGDVLPTANVVSAVLLLPGPAVASTEMSFTHVTAALSFGYKTGLTFAHSRDAAHVDDTNANSLHILSVLWEILPQG